MYSGFAINDYCILKYTQLSEEPGIHGSPGTSTGTSTGTSALHVHHFLNIAYITIQVAKLKGVINAATITLIYDQHPSQNPHLN